MEHDIIASSIDAAISPSSSADTNPEIDYFEMLVFFYL